MRADHRIAVIIPALNEAASLGAMLPELPDWIDEVIVVDNGSTDATAAVARQCGARVVAEPVRGYGHACLAGARATEADILLFLDGDGSDRPTLAARVVDPIAGGLADMVIGSRVLGNREPGALSPQQRWGNALACVLMRRLWGARHTDLGPFRAIRREALLALDLQALTYGWTVEMQIRAHRMGLRVVEVPVDYRRRIAGRSKVSGTVRGVALAAWYILGTIAVEATRPATLPPPPIPEPSAPGEREQPA
ncbi:MAG: glycosyltransferase family 2 protein [Sphingomonas sp.]